MAVVFRFSGVVCGSGSALDLVPDGGLNLRP